MALGRLITQPPQAVFISSNRLNRVLPPPLKSSAASEDLPDPSIQEALRLAEPTLTLAAKGVIETATREVVRLSPNRVSRKLSAASFRAVILGPPVPADWLMEPEVSSTRAISSCMPWATERLVTGMVETPNSLEK